MFTSEFVLISSGNWIRKQFRPTTGFCLDYANKTKSLLQFLRPTVVGSDKTIKIKQQIKEKCLQEL